VSLEDILITPLKRIPTDGGDVMHALKESDTGFNGFGEVYFSWIDQNVIRAWKCHQRMTMNLIVPIGEVNFAFHVKNQKNNFRVESIGEKRYVRLTVPPGIWFGFQGISDGHSLLMNFADLEHNPDEVERTPISAFSYDWSSE